MIVGLVHYQTAGAFAVLEREKCLVTWMSLGSVAGVAIGGLLFGIVSPRALTVFLGIGLAVSATKVFKNA